MNICGRRRRFHLSDPFAQQTPLCLVCLGIFTRNPTQDQPWPADAHGCALPVSVLKPGSNLPRSIREYDAQGVIDNGNALVDGTAGQLAC